MLQSMYTLFGLHRCCSDTLTAAGADLCCVLAAVLLPDSAAD